MDTSITSLGQPRQDNALASNISTCQEQLARVLQSLEATNGRLSNLTERVDRIEQKLEEQPAMEEQGKPTSKGKRKRTKDSLTIQVFINKSLNRITLIIVKVI